MSVNAGHKPVQRVMGAPLSEGFGMLLFDLGVTWFSVKTKTGARFDYLIQNWR
jgi:hypothetical protein